MLRVLQSAHHASYACALGLVVPRLTPPRVEPEAAGLAAAGDQGEIARRSGGDQGAAGLAAVPVQRIADAVG